MNMISFVHGGLCPDSPWTFTLDMSNQPIPEPRGEPQNYRAMIMRDRVHPAVMDEAGTESAEDAISQADTLWQRLDSTSKGTFALALLMLLESRPSSWPLVLTVVLYSLHPRPRDLPTHPWG